MAGSCGYRRYNRRKQSNRAIFHQSDPGKSNYCNSDCHIHCNTNFRSSRRLCWKSIYRYCYSKSQTCCNSDSKLLRRKWSCSAYCTSRSTGLYLFMEHWRQYSNDKCKSCRHIYCDHLQWLVFFNCLSWGISRTCNKW